MCSSDLIDQDLIEILMDSVLNRSAVGFLGDGFHFDFPLVWLIALSDTSITHALEFVKRFAHEFSGLNLKI